MPYFPALDGVRAYCVLLVMFDHLKGGHTPGWINGHLGVDLFFIISGFLITTLLWREQTFTGSLNMKAFYWRRFFRIVPVYATVLLLYIAVLQLPSQAARWLQFRPALPYFLTLMNEFAVEPGRGSVFLHTWSLGVEEKFYLAWPLLFLIFARTQRSRLLVIGVALTIVAAASLLGHEYLARAYFGLLMGCIMAFALAGSYARQIFRLLARLPPSAALAIFLLGFAAEHVSKYLVTVFSAAAVIFLSSLLARTSWLSRLHEGRALVWLGQRSYAMYLVHVLCLNVFEARVQISSGWRAAAVLAAAYLLCAGVGALLHSAVEQPVRDFGRRYLARNREIAAAV